MPVPAAIVEWWGPYGTLEEIRNEVETKFDDGNHLLCMALRDEENPESPVRCRHLIGWKRQTIGEREIIALPDECRWTEDGTPTVYYVGWIASHDARWTRCAAEWALVRRLRPEVNEEPDSAPPGHRHYCVAVASWFYPPPVPDWDYEAAVCPPRGFPAMIMYNRYG